MPWLWREKLCLAHSKHLKSSSDLLAPKPTQLSSAGITIRKILKKWLVAHLYLDISCCHSFEQKCPNLYLEQKTPAKNVKNKLVNIIFSIFDALVFTPDPSNCSKIPFCL